MDSIELYYSSESDEEIPFKVQYKQLRDNSNIFELPERRFIKLFRLSKDAVKYLLEELSDDLDRGSRSSTINALLKIAATLRFLSQGSYQQSVGQEYLVGMSQSTVSNILREVIGVIEGTLCQKWISFRQNQTQRQSCSRYFYEKYGFPSVIGCIDGTHIKIIRPTENEHLFYSRKGYHSINAMIACDHHMRIMCVDPRFGGASHDSMVWGLSNYRSYLEEQRNNSQTESNFWLLGDSGYPLEMWLITPFRSAAEGSREATFNSIHSRARNIIERCIGLLKQRFRCLLGARELHYSPPTATKIINACSVLHNICLHFKVPFEDFDEGFSDNFIHISQDADTDTPVNERARQLRNSILNSIC